MTIKRQFNFDETKITAQAIDETNSYLWLAFSKNVDGYCLLKKVSAFQPDQVFYSIEIEVDEITAMKISGSYIYLSYNDSTYIGSRYSLTSPLTSYTNFAKPIGLNEYPIDVQVTSNYTFFLLPGNLSGENSKIIKTTLTGIYAETIDLTTIQNISSFVVIDNTNMWAVTNTSPTELVRIYNDGSWNYSSY